MVLRRAAMALLMLLAACGEGKKPHTPAADIINALGDTTPVIVPPLQLTAKAPPITFTTGSEAAGWLKSGWSGLESHGIWSLADVAEMHIRLDPATANAPLELIFEVGGYINAKQASQIVTVKSGDVELTTWTFDKANPSGDRKVLLPANLVAPPQPVSLVFNISAAKSPKELGLGEDVRRLGLHMTSVRVGNVAGQPAASSP